MKVKQFIIDNKKYILNWLISCIIIDIIFFRGGKK